MRRKKRNFNIQQRNSSKLRNGKERERKGLHYYRSNQSIGYSVWKIAKLLFVPARKQQQHLHLQMHCNSSKEFLREKIKQENLNSYD